MLSPDLIHVLNYVGELIIVTAAAVIQEELCLLVSLCWSADLSSPIPLQQHMQAAQH